VQPVRYEVQAVRVGVSLWELRILGVGCTQTDVPALARAMVRDYLKTLGHPQARTAPIHINWQ
jgi:hypothetical protein